MTNLTLYGQGGGETPAIADNRDFSNPMYGLRSGAVEAPEAAVLAPSSVTHQTPPQANRHRELNPATIDTGKDTHRSIKQQYPNLLSPAQIGGLIFCP